MEKLAGAFIHECRKNFSLKFFKELNFTFDTKKLKYS